MAVKVKYNEKTDAVPERTGGGRQKVVFQNKITVEVELGKFQGLVMPSGDMLISTVGKVIGNDGLPIKGAPWADFSLALPYQNPELAGHEVEEKTKATRYRDCYQFSRAFNSTQSAKFLWNKQDKVFTDADGNGVDSDKASSHNKDCEREGAAFVAGIFNALLENLREEDSAEDVLGAGEFRTTRLTEVLDITGERAFGVLYHKDETYTTKKGEEKQKAPRVYGLRTDAPDVVMYDDSDLFVPQS